MIKKITKSPVKIFLHVFPSVAPWHIATVCLGLSVYIWISEFKELLYFGVKIFFHSVLSIFFREVEIIGIQKTPRHGPIIYTINHANQFMDAVMVLTTCQNKISYLMAETSYKRRVVGDIAWALDVVPVKRPQDSAIKGIGKVKFANQEYETTKVLSVEGSEGSKFTEQLAPSDKIRPTGTPAGAKVMEVIDDTTMLVDGTDIPHEELEKFLSNESNTFDILKHIKQSVVFEKGKLYLVCYWGLKHTRGRGGVLTGREVSLSFFVILIYSY